jgi:hypothetical protein
MAYKQKRKEQGNMKTIEINAYTASELKNECPKGFEKAFNSFRQGEYEHGLNWGREMFDSLKALIELGGYKLKSYSLGDSSCRDNHIRLEEKDCDELSGNRAMAWFENNILSKLRDKKGKLDAGKLTGYCMDYTLVESLEESIRSGSTIKDAFRDLVTPYVSQVDAEWEGQTSEEAFLDQSDANDWQFLSDGRIV